MALRFITQLAGALACAVVIHGAAMGAVVEKVIHAFKGGNDGANPVAQLIEVNGTLYGTTAIGGGTGCAPSHGCGTVFSIRPKGTERIRYTFNGGSDGASPTARLIEVGGVLYGTTNKVGTLHPAPSTATPSAVARYSR